MVTLAPIQVDITSVPTTPPPGSLTVIGVVAGVEYIPPLIRSISETVSRPIAIQNLDDAQLAFGLDSYAYLAAQHVLAISDTYVLGILFEIGDRDANGVPLVVYADRDPDDIKADAIQAINDMESAVQSAGLKPSVIISPGWNGAYNNPSVNNVSTYQTETLAETTDANDFVTQLQTTCEKLRSVAFVGAAGRGKALTNLAVTELWSTNNGGPRILGVAQNVDTPFGDDVPGEIIMAANLARNDALNGISDSFSNREVVGFTSVFPRRSFEYIGSTSDALRLRNNYISTLARDPNGVWRVIGGLMRTTNPLDPLRYLGVRRLVDVIAERVVQFAVNRWNRNMTDNFIDRLVTDVRSYLGLLVSSGALRRAVVGPDTVRNTPTARAAGLVYVAIQLFHPAINEQINFSVEVNLA